MPSSFTLRAIGLTCFALVLAACHRGEDATSSFPRAETLYIGGLKWGEPTSFNPLLSEPDWPGPGSEGGYNLLYEMLLLYNVQTGKEEPLLAESFTIGEDAIDVVLNPAARWSDGEPVTGWDVKYTFELGKTYKSLTVSPRWKYLLEIKVSDDGGKVVAAPAGSAKGTNYPRHVSFVLAKNPHNPLIVLDSLQDTPILPRHVFEPLFAGAHGDLDEMNKLKFDQDPVGSGPYRLSSYSSEKIVLVRDDGYWGNAALYGGKLPAPKYIVHPIYKSNDHYSVALQQGRLDASACFVPRIWLKQPRGVRSWYDKEPFFVSSSIPMLIPNVTHKPLNDARMRRAMAYAINYRDIRELAVSGYSEPIRPGLILPFGLESKYFSEEDAQKYGTSYDPEKAKALLKEAGYAPVFDKNGELVETRDRDGKVVPTIYIKSPTGWSDWESIVRIAVKNLRDVGIDARERFIDTNLYFVGLFTGDFDAILHTPAFQPTPSKPWSRFDAVLTSADWSPDGGKMYKNWGRFNNPAAPDYNPRVEALLNLIPTLKDEGELTAAYRELNVIFMQAQVTLPLVYRPDQFYEVSIRHWDNFPSAKNPYKPAQIPGDRLGTSVLWELRAVEQH